MKDIDVLLRMEEAATTLKNMVVREGRPPREYQSAWPEWLRDVMLAYGYDSANDDLDAKARIRPSPEEIDRADEAIPWLQLVDRDSAYAIWARANGRSWRYCARQYGVSDPRTGRKKVLEACAVIAGELRAAA